MKSLFFSVLFACIIFSSSLQAQTLFAPAGAEWYHSITDMGVFHSYYTGDTVISGISCRSIVRKAITEPPYSTAGLYIRDLPTLYFYNSSDTVFIYNSLFNRFTPLYVFNVHDGDTVRLTILPPEVNEFSGPYADSTFGFVVDSVRMVLYDTATLKTVYTRRIGNCTNTRYVYTYGNGDSIGAYAERIGGISIGLSPQYVCGANLVDMSYETQGALRCYNDPTLSVKLVSGICGAPPSTSVAAMNKQAISIFPNPATDIINIINEIPTSSTLVSITNVDGREMMNEILFNNMHNTAINISQLPSGVYIVKLVIDNTAPVYKKISVLH
jgi:hypothetical protein